MEPTLTARVALATKELIADGKLIEAGWLSYRMFVLPRDASAVQVDETRKAFFAGSQHLFASLMCALDPGQEPTNEDSGRFYAIHDELAAFGKELERSIQKQK